jgi:hypothetical protein
MQSKVLKISIGKKHCWHARITVLATMDVAVVLIFSELLTGKTMQERGGKLSCCTNKEIENRRLQLIQDIEKKK